MNRFQSKYASFGCHLVVMIFSLTCMGQIIEAQDNSVEAAPVISFETPVYQFGKVQQGEEIRHDFKFSNQGSQVLVIEDVRPSCGCTTAAGRSGETRTRGRPWSRSAEDVNQSS